MLTAEQLHERCHLSCIAVVTSAMHELSKLSDRPTAYSYTLVT